MADETFDSVWDAIEDTPQEAENMRLRSRLMIALTEHIESSGWTQVSAAERLGVTQLAGADVHTAWELLRNGTLVRLDGSGPLRQQLLGSPRSLSTRATPRTLRRYSQVVKRIRARIGLGGHA